MITQAEYGAEIEAETPEKDPSELQYITPVSYTHLDVYKRQASDVFSKWPRMPPFSMLMTGNSASGEQVHGASTSFL